MELGRTEKLASGFRPRDVGAGAIPHAPAGGGDHLDASKRHAIRHPLRASLPQQSRMALDSHLPRFDAVYAAKVHDIEPVCQAKAHAVGLDNAMSFSTREWEWNLH